MFEETQSFGFKLSTVLFFSELYRFLAQLSAPKIDLHPENF